MFKVIIAGSRSFQDYELLKKKCDQILSSIKDEITIISGTAKGADQLGEKYAQERKYWLMEFPAPWNDIEGKPQKEIGFKNGTKYWKLAGHYRNSLMADEADALIAFNVGNSSGTLNMIDKAKEKGLKIREIKL